MSRCQKNGLFYPTERIPTKYYILSILYIYFHFFRIVGRKVNILTYLTNYQ